MTMTLRRLSVASRRNSVCGSAKLADLDWSNWWQDLWHIHVLHKDGETWHRVFCRRDERPRLEMRNGKLMWLVHVEDRRA